MSQPYGFCWDVFVLDLRAARALYKHGERLDLTPTEIAILGVLVARAPNAVDEDTMWGQIRRTTVRKTSLPEHVSRLRRKLDADHTYQYIPKSEHGEGYRFVRSGVFPILEEATLDALLSGTVSAGDFTDNAESINSGVVTVEPEPEPPTIPSRDLPSNLALCVAAFFLIAAALISSSAPLAPRLEPLYLLACALAYGGLSACNLALEGAYEFETYGWLRWKKMYLAIFILNGSAMFSAMRSVTVLEISGIGYGLFVGLGVLIAGNLISCAAVFFVLPNRPVTKALFQTQAAFGAYCKNVLLYNLPVYVFFVLLPWGLIQTGGEYSKNIFVAAALLIAFLLSGGVSMIGTNFLSDRLVSEKNGTRYEYHGLFSTLLIMRTILLFLPGFVGALVYLFHTLKR